MRELPRNYSSVRREGGGIRTVVRVKGGGGGGRERLAPRKLRLGKRVGTKTVGRRES